ncbi:MAG: hypothetical protein H0W76_14890 [Pyrinomonadaceae bacterium]|nr:hypothetical protein [Pyrinomonadaceae bacterium]
MHTLNRQSICLKVAAVLLLASVFLTVRVEAGIGYRSAPYQETVKSNEKKQFIYVLKLIPRLLDEKKWTARDSQIVERHFRRLQQLHKEGIVVLAGRTLNESDPNQMGIVILSVESEKEARAIMENDDAVKEKIMTAQLFPFGIALIK